MNRLQKILSVGAILLTVGACKEYVTEYSKIKHEDAEVVNRITGFNYPLNSYYNTTFRGKIYFVIDDREIYNRFNLNDSADVNYREVYRTTLEDTDKDGKKEVIDRKFIGYQFIDAVPIDNIKK